MRFRFCHLLKKLKSSFSSAEKKLLYHNIIILLAKFSRTSHYLFAFRFELTPFYNLYSCEFWRTDIIVSFFLKNQGRKNGNTGCAQIKLGTEYCFSFFMCVHLSGNRLITTCSKCVTSCHLTSIYYIIYVGGSWRKSCALQIAPLHLAHACRYINKNMYKWEKNVHGKIILIKIYREKILCILLHL